MNDETQSAFPDDDPHGLAVQPLTSFCTSTKAGSTPPFLWKEYEKQQQGTSDVYSLTVRGQECVVGTGEQGDADVRACCSLVKAHYVTPQVGLLAGYAPLVVLLFIFIGIGIYHAWRNEIARQINNRPLT